MKAHYEDTKSNTFFSQLTNIKQKGSMEKHIEDFQKLTIRVNDILEEHRVDVFIGNLKDNIQHEVHLWEPDALEKKIRLARKIERKIMATRKPTTHNYKDGSVAAPRLPRPTRLTSQQLEEKRAKGIFYSCDNKYTKGHKCAKNKLFYIYCEYEEEKEHKTSKEEDIHQEPTLYCNALAGITTPQTLKIEGHIKKKMEVEYLGHILSHEGVKVDPNKIKSIKEWKIPMKKDAFSWTQEAIKAFEHLKEAMCQAPVLATPNFTKSIIVECDASRNGICTILMQEGKPIAFETCPIK
eukprot:PITA_02770